MLTVDGTITYDTILGATGHSLPSDSIMLSDQEVSVKPISKLICQSGCLNVIGFKISAVGFARSRDRQRAPD